MIKVVVRIPPESYACDSFSHLCVGTSKIINGEITHVCKFELNRSSKLRDNNERKITLVTRSCVLSDASFRDLKIQFKLVENYFFLENYVTSEGAVSHNVLYHQPLPITCHQERFYANNYFESLYQQCPLPLTMGVEIILPPCCNPRVNFANPTLCSNPRFQNANPSGSAYQRKVPGPFEEMKRPLISVA